MSLQVVSRINQMRRQNLPPSRDVPLSDIYLQFLKDNNFSPADTARANSIMTQMWCV